MTEATQKQQQQQQQHNYFMHIKQLALSKGVFDIVLNGFNFLKSGNSIFN